MTKIIKGKWKDFNPSVKQFKQPIVLFACCGPCSTIALERLQAEYKVYVFFCGDNLESREEFDKRLNAIHEVCQYFRVSYSWKAYNPQKFRDFVKGHETDAEGGERCNLCFKYRFEETRKFANSLGTEFFTTSLTTSPHKNAETIKQIGENFDGYLHFDFKENGGFARSVELSKQLGIYRQNFCGCEFSRKS